MLILQRKVGESLLIGDNVSISIVSVKKGQVRLAISAPVEIPILRSELLAVAEANTDSVIEGADPAALLALLHGGDEKDAPERKDKKGDDTV